MTKTGSIYPDSRKSCSRCSHLAPLPQKRCLTCSSTTFQPHYCSPQSRGGVFIEALFEVRLFPLGQQTFDVSATMMVKKARKLTKYYHQCKTLSGGPCHLRDTLDNLHVELEGIMNSVRGLCMICARLGLEPRLSKVTGTCTGPLRHMVNEHLEAHERRIGFNKRAHLDLDEDGIEE
jgi:hypothetical protein